MQRQQVVDGEVAAQRAALQAQHRHARAEDVPDHLPAASEERVLRKPGEDEIHRGAPLD